MTNCFAFLTTHSTRRWINTFITFSNSPYICFPFQFSVLFSFSNFLKFFFETLFLNFRILTCFTSWSKFSFEFWSLSYHPRLFSLLLIVLLQLTSHLLPSLANVKSVYRLLGEVFYALWGVSECSYLTLLVCQISILTLQHHISLLLQSSCLSLLFYSFHLT